MNLKLLRQKRKEKKYNQKQVAEFVGLSRASYCNKETGNLDFTRRDIMEISMVLDLSNVDIINIFFPDSLDMG